MRGKDFRTIGNFDEHQDHPAYAGKSTVPFAQEPYRRITPAYAGKKGSIFITSLLYY